MYAVRKCNFSRILWGLGAAIKLPIPISHPAMQNPRLVSSTGAAFRSPTNPSAAARDPRRVAIRRPGETSGKKKILKCRSLRFILVCLRQ